MRGEKLWVSGLAEVEAWLTEYQMLLCYDLIYYKKEKKYARSMLYISIHYSGDGLP